MLGDIGPLEIGIVLVVALLVFGPKKLPELGHGLGKGVPEFKTGITGDSAAPVEAAQIAADAREGDPETAEDVTR